MCERFAAFLREARETGRPVAVPAEVVGELLLSSPAVAFTEATRRLCETPGVSPVELGAIRAGLLAVAQEPPDDNR